ncbi:penicillin-binding protein 1C [Permianibacter sp. IMCC34836]|uniref:transglycosylase domain-containing protein n=1 Tax=Permianibacter fluminis TaxID=2738515 RepID=UPI0015533A12|nr:transglycosylase domain-containing protein [Permianibacter fluminis]NQD37800.1 penicillin-binding protein 1C [Permianibacter fluminis]
MAVIRQRPVAVVLAVLVSALLLLTVLTWQATQPLPSLQQVVQRTEGVTLLDRNGRRLLAASGDGWNVQEQVGLHDIPPILANAFLVAEDQRFFTHAGVDWLARSAALWQNVAAGRKVRGASTISEQVVRLLHPRPRTMWSRWLEGFEATALERQESKHSILEFYLNQVPYAHERRGVRQAAEYYFDRDLATLNLKEMLALAVLVRAPASLDLRKSNQTTEAAIQRLAKRMLVNNMLDRTAWQNQADVPLQLLAPKVPQLAHHFVQYVRQQLPNAKGVLQTTLDSSLQANIQALLDARLADLKTLRVHNGAVLVADHERGEILAWVVSGNLSATTPGAFYDAVLVPRQPGSTLKPFIYATAMEHGWTAATLVKDEPLQQAVGRGLHQYRNYSRIHYGDISVREALANSLNVPAVKALQAVGAAEVLERLRAVGMSSLALDAAVYGDGLALGNGEVSLLQLVAAYSAMAERGVYRPLRFYLGMSAPEQPVFEPEISSLIANILADNDARQLEFGTGNSLNFAVQTAVKTGTSNDYRDAWLLAFDSRYTVGVWFGNLDRRPMLDVTGSIGPALLARAIFSELNRQHDSKPLWLSPKLIKAPVCLTKSTDSNCTYRDEWFVAGTQPVSAATPLQHKTEAALHFLQPTDYLDMAMDPRIPDDLERFHFELAGVNGAKKIRWKLNDALLAETKVATYLWPMRRGQYALQAEVSFVDGKSRLIGPIHFTVK